MTETTSDASAQARATVNGAARKPLKIERVWTKPGVHPYDDVKWERRDVIQTDGRTGEPIFEQHGMEYPAPWSLTAATLRTTKNFGRPVASAGRDGWRRQ